MDEKMWETLYDKILEGDILNVLSYVIEYITKEDFFVNGSLKKICVSLLLLAVFAGVFCTFTDSFKGKAVSQMSVLMIHILLFSVLITLYYEMFSVTKEVLKSVVTVMNAAIPVYYVAVISSGHGLSGYTYYRISILVIYVVEQFFLQGLLPVITGYMILNFGNVLWLEKKLSSVTSFIKKILEMVLKATIGAVSGVSFLQAMVSPVMDEMKQAAVGKTVAAIPGIGKAAEGVAELTVGSLVLIKNSVGLCAFLMLVITAAVPVIKLLVVGLLLRGCGAIMGIISEKDFANPVIYTSEAIEMLLKMVLTVLLLFGVSMAIVLFTTNA